MRFLTVDKTRNAVDHNSWEKYNREINSNVARSLSGNWNRTYLEFKHVQRYEISNVDTDKYINVTDKSFII